jgi:predicted RNase H-like HicB family nuclease
MKTETPHEHEDVLTVDGREYRCLFRRDAGGGCLVTCEDIPPMVAYGATLDQARTNAAAEIRASIEARENHYDPFRELHNWTQL